MNVWDTKDEYDKEILIFLDVGDWTLLRLHKGYKIPFTLGVTKKLTQHYVGPFQVLERVGRPAYKLDIPEGWLIHSVFTVAQLDPRPNPAYDPFKLPKERNRAAKEATRKRKHAERARQAAEEGSSGEAATGGRELEGMGARGHENRADLFFVP